MEDLTRERLLEYASRALHSKETKKKNKRETLPMDGFGRHLTAPEFIAAKEEAERLRDEEIADKAKGADDREAAKAAKEQLKEEWEQIKADHAKVVELWEEECARLKDEGVSKKNLPKKPKRARKPKAPAKATTEDETDGDQTGSDDD
ncbi:hypothetical protein B0H16DRAFT_1472425 [Mycena metata]|uniref:Uncharacterized protein n=1 Tax=Mycena metata TaxID=1033252 RepID=A0AAD7HP71_9AGAR|nr:hypothetical protein B0H16DRAFT_1472425 [Mycena metata]